MKNFLILSLFLILFLGSGFASSSKIFSDYMESDTVTPESNFNNKLLGHIELGDLYYKNQITFKCGGLFYTTGLKEGLGFTANALFDDTPLKSGLKLNINSKDLQYVIDLGSGIFTNNECKTGLGTKTNFIDDTAGDNVKIPLFGKEMQVYSYNITNKTLTLIDEDAIKTYNKGSMIGGLQGKDGKSYYALVKDFISGTKPRVILGLYNSETNVVIAGYENVKLVQGNYFADAILKSKILIKDIFNIGSSDVSNWKTEVIFDPVILKDGAGYPYDLTVRPKWTVYITTLNDKITKITFKNNVYWGQTNSKALKPGESASFVGDKFALKFVGLNLPEFNSTNPVETGEFKLGNNELVYEDIDGNSHTVPFYIKQSFVKSEQIGGVVSYFKIDGRTIYWATSFIDANTKDGDSIIFYEIFQNGVVWMTSIPYVNEEDNGILEIPTNDEQNEHWKYSLLVNKDENSITFWLLLSNQNILLPSFSGTYLTFGSTIIDGNSLIENFPYFLPDDEQLPQKYQFDSNFKLTVWRLEETGKPWEDTVYFVIDPSNGNIITPGSTVDLTGDLVYGVMSESDKAKEMWVLEENNSKEHISEAYTDYGTKVTLKDHVATVVYPKEQAMAELQVFSN